jgi:DNA invertase Pin-like site-specific DNA recombinase
LKAIGYIRVSTAEQGLSGLGLKAQRKTIEDNCLSKGWELVEIFEDHGSAKSMAGRPALAAAISAIEEGQGGCLVVAKLDRLSRSVLNFATLVARADEAGWSIAALDVGVNGAEPGGRLIQNIFLSVAQWEREILSNRTKAALAQYEGTLGRPRSIDPSTETRIVAMRRHGQTFDQIAATLNSEATLTPTGKAWGKTHVRGVCQRHPELPIFPRGRRAKVAA